MMLGKKFFLILVALTLALQSFVIRAYASATNQAVSNVQLTALGQASGSLKVTWENPDIALSDPQIQGFQFEVVLASDLTRVLLTEPVAAGTSYVISGLTNGTMYKVAVVALYETAQSVSIISDNAVAPLSPPAVPSTPGAPSAERSGGGEVTLTWLPPESNGSDISSYEIICAPICSDTITSEVSTVVISGLTPAATYSFKVKATNETGTSQISEASNEVKPFATITEPANVAITVVETTAKVTWTNPIISGIDPSFDTFAYKLQLFKASDMTTALVTKSNLSIKSVDLSGLEKGASYRLQITTSVNGITGATYTSNAFGPLQETTKTISLKVRSKTSAQSLATGIGMDVPAKSKIAILVSKASKKICKVSSSKLVATKPGSCTVTVTVYAPKPALVTKSGSVSVTSGKLTAAQVASSIGATIPAKSKVSISVANSSKKICSASGTSVKVKKTGICYVKMKIQAPKPAPVKKTSTISVS